MFYQSALFNCKSKFLVILTKGAVLYSATIGGVSGAILSS